MGTPEYAESLGKMTQLACKIDTVSARIALYYCKV